MLRHPPLVWPAWLVHVRGGKLATQAGVDRAGHEYLKSRYISSAPMTEIYAFYEDSLKANGYPVHSSELATGQTISGVVQNAERTRGRHQLSERSSRTLYGDQSRF